MTRKSLNPLVIMRIWVLLVLISDLIFVPYYIYHSSGGEQKPLTYLASSITIAIGGIFILSILAVILYFRWFKQYWFVNCIIFLVSGFYLFTILNKETNYSFAETNDSIGGNEIRKRIEYYDMDKNEVRSISYWKNGIKDSVWTIYSKNGSILQQERYKEGSKYYE